MPQESWSIAEGSADTYKYQVRYRTFPHDFPRHNFPVRLNVFWAMDESTSEGFPTERELEKLHTFENRLVAATEAEGLTVLAAVLTGRAEREFVFYARDSSQFLAQLSAMPQERERYPIEIHKNDDAEWLYYSDAVPAEGEA